MLACALLAFTFSLVTVKIRKLFEFTKFSATKSSVPIVNKAEVILRCDTKPGLPFSIKVLLDKNFPGWQFPEVSDDDCQSVKTWGGKDAYPQVIQGDFDGDGQSDYAVLIDVNSGTDEQGRLAYRPDVYIVAFLARSDGYQI